MKCGDYDDFSGKLMPWLKKCLKGPIVNRSIREFEGYITNLPKASSEVVGLFDNFLLNYPECPNKGVFKSNGVCPITTKKILNKIVPRVDCKTDGAIIFFKRERKSKLVEILERELIKEEDQFIQSQETTAVNFALINTCINSMKYYLNDYITVGLQAELNTCLESEAEISFERDVRRALVRHFNFELVEALKKDEKDDPMRFDHCLSRCLFRELQSNLSDDLKKTDSLVCLTKWGIFWVVGENDGSHSWVQFDDYASVRKCALSGKHHLNKTLKVTMNNGSECYIHTENQKLANEISAFICSSRNSI